jgi:propionate CoA-transferase
VKRGQTALVITERAVFEVTTEGLTLTEVAPGIDVRRDVLDQMEFAPSKVADDLKFMDQEFFLDMPRAKAS